MSSTPPPSYQEQVMTIARSCSFMGGAIGAAAYLFLTQGTLSGRSLLTVLVGGAVGYAGRMLNDQVLGTPGVSKGPIPDDMVSCYLFGGALGAATAYAGKAYMQ